MKRTLLIILFLLLALSALPAAEAGTQIKTVGFFIDQRLQNAQSDVIGGGSWDSRNVAINLPESSIKIISSWVEFRAVSTSLTSQIINVSLTINNTQISNANKSKPVYYLGSTIEEYPFSVYGDATTFISSKTWPGVNGVNVSARINGTTTNQHNAVLWITYSYDDTSPIQLNTVIYPIYTWNTTVAAGSAIKINFTTYIPESESIASQWANIYGWVDCAGTGVDALLHVNMSGGDIDNAKPLYAECGSLASYDTLWMFNLTGTNFAVNQNQSIGINTTTQVFETLGGEIFVTYNTTIANQNNLTKTVAYFLGQSTNNPTTLVHNLTQTFFLPETGATVRQAWAHVLLGWTATSAGSALVSGKVGSTTVPPIRYQLNAPGETMGQNQVIYNLTGAASSLTNGTSVFLNVSYSAATSDTASAILYVTYTYAKATTDYQTTIQYFVGNSPGEQNDNESAVTINLPENLDQAFQVRLNTFLHAISMSNASVNVYNVSTNFSLTSSRLKVPLGNSVIRRTAAILNNDTQGVITGNGTYTIGAQRTTPAAAAGVAFASKLFFTYTPSNDTVAPTASSIITNATPNIKQNDWVNFSTLWTDNKKLSGYWFSLNQSANANSNSTPQDFLGSPASGVSSNVTLITAKPGQRISWRFIANDTARNNGTMSVQDFFVNPGLRYNNTFNDNGDNLTGLTAAAVAVGDFTGDGILDFVIMGMNLTTAVPDPVTFAYTGDKNKNSIVRNRSWDMNITPLGLGSLALADFDNDGRLDLIETGQNETLGSSGRQAWVYTNNGTGFRQNVSWSSNLTGVLNSSIAVGDLNNDGKVDAILSGSARIGAASRQAGLTFVYINTGTTLRYNSTFSAGLMRVNRSSLVLADFDNNTELDLIVAGQTNTLNTTAVYTNNGASFAYNLTLGGNLSNSSNANILAGDVDNDGKMDLVQLLGDGTPPRARIYINNGTNFLLLENLSWEVNVTALIDSQASLGDIDNDGWLDLVTSGRTAVNPTLSSVLTYINNRTGFAETLSFESEVASIDQGDVVLADFTNDTSLDLIAAGRRLPNGDNITRIYTSDAHLNRTNTAPSPPTNLSFFVVANQGINLTWTGGSDTETPTPGLYYNIRMGTCTGCNDIVSSAHGGSGPGADGLFGNMQKKQRTTLVINSSNTYYWSVQTIDTGLMKSAFSTEQVINPASGADITPPTWDTQAQSASTVSQSGTLNLSANVADTVGLSVAFLSTNESGVWVNYTRGDRYGSPLNMSGTSGTASFIWTNYSLEGGVNIGWIIYVNDTSGNVAQTGQLNFTLLKTISISINPNALEMGKLAPGGYNSTGTTAGYNPLPFVINNTGNFATNVTIGAGDLFQTVANPNIYFQFRSVVNETNSVRNTVLELISSFLNIPATASAVMVANMTNFTEYNNEIRVHINVTVPTNEPPANLTSTVTFTASQAY
jgi:hypothetical protein